MKTRTPVLATLILVLGAAAAKAQPGQPPQGERPAVQEPATIDLTALLERVGAEIEREFIVYPGAPTQMRVTTTDLATADYDTLLGLLRVNNLIAVETADDQVLVIPEATMRLAPTPLVQDDDARISDHAVVTRVLEVPPTPVRAGDGEDETVPAAAALVPVLRPMMSPSGHLSAPVASGHLIITDYYDNVRRLTAVIEALGD